MASKLFKPDTPLMIVLTQITDVIFLSLMWLLGCLPVVTVGASFASLYDASYRVFRQGEKYGLKRFGSVFTANWKAGILPTAVFIAASAGLVKGMIFFWNGAVAGTVSWAVFAGAAFVGIVVLGILSVLFPVLSRFENSFAGLLKNTLLLALANLPRTIALGVLNAVAVYLCARFVVPLFFLPALTALIGSLFIEPMFKPYMPESDEEAAE